MKEERKEEYIYAGIPTFMGGEFIRENEIKNYDIVFLGVPCDYGASYRLGAKYAPRQLREYSFWDRIYGEELYDLDHSEYLKTNDFKIADLGDVMLIQRIQTKIKMQYQKRLMQLLRIVFQLYVVVIIL